MSQKRILAGVFLSSIPMAAVLIWAMVVTIMTPPLPSKSLIGTRPSDCNLFETVTQIYPSS